MVSISVSTSGRLVLCAGTGESCALDSSVDYGAVYVVCLLTSYMLPHRVGHGLDASMDWIGLDWVGLDWVKCWKNFDGFDWIGLDCGEWMM